MSKGWKLLFVVAVLVVVLAASWTLAAPRKPKYTKCPAQGCTGVCDLTQQGPLECVDRKTGEALVGITYECCCCVENPKHRWYRGLR